jgi:uncharacterized protein
MNKTLAAIRQNKQLRVIGFDDSPFSSARGSLVNIAGVVCSNTRFEGMLWGEVKKDGNDATEVLIDMITASKFHSQLHAILLDGIAFGGFNIIDLPKLANAVVIPCIAVMRKPPDLNAINRALKNFDDYTLKSKTLAQAGEVTDSQGFVFQVAGIDNGSAAIILQKVTDTGKVPEALRIAHLIGAAVKTGESSRRA